MWWQTEIKLQAKPRGVHLITDEILQNFPVLKNIEIGLIHIFIQHTSASLAVNENADPSVRKDVESFLNRVAPENPNFYEHIDEGPDDMPAHLKSILTGSEITLPISNGHLKLGTWQGIYLCEHRDSAVARNIVVTIQGQEFS
jgi:secondary thiamine-phosphate synthase enzyme